MPAAALTKIDLHTHILPKSWPDLRERYGYGGFISLDHYAPCCARMMIDGKPFREITANSWDPAARLEECDRRGVQMQVLSTVPVMFSYWAKPEHGHDLSRILNDHIAEVVRAHPTRFAGLGTLPMQDPALAIKELERCARDLGLAGIQIGSHIERPGGVGGPGGQSEADWNLSDPQVYDVLAAAESLGAAVFVHPWDMMGTANMSKYWLPWLVGMPAETCRAICSVIFGGVLDRLPRLRIAFAHGGGSFPGTIGRIEHGWRVRPDLCAVDCRTNPRDYLRQGPRPARFYVDSLVHDAAALRHLIDLMGPERIALGSDYPFPLGEEEPGGLIESMGLEPNVAEQLLRGTALEFLGSAAAVVRT